MKRQIWTLVVVFLAGLALGLAFARPLFAETFWGRKSAEKSDRSFFGEDDSFRDSRRLPLEEEFSPDSRF